MSKYGYGAMVPPPNGPDFTDVQFVSQVYQSFVTACLSGHFDDELPEGVGKGLFRSRPNGDDIELVLHDGGQERLFATWRTAAGNFRLNAAGQFVGAVTFFAASVPPLGWIKANGAELARDTYPELFAIIGTSFGVGDGATTFNLPDLRGEFLRGWDDGRGVDSGRVFGSSQQDAMQDHNHFLGLSQYGSAGRFGVKSGQADVRAIENSSASTNANITSPPDTAGGGAPRTGSETRPRNMALLPCICFEGSLS
ncbi:phage tail protein [Cognatishimia sp. MH4019]|uniref:phage tail protein n=1 Tax=Cognatishimia sp. MH4019 TaxID=2854030 RepID=UPI001CD5C1B7|nr:phage tail protein [Cognatishimia sp. MH4019]